VNPRFATLALYFPFKSPELQTPFSLLRAHLYPEPGMLPVVQEAVQEYIDAEGHYEQPMYLPQKFGFRRHMTPPWHLAWQSMVTSPAVAGQMGNAMRDQFLAMHDELMLSPREAALARDALRLPQPSDNWHFNPDPEVKELPEHDVQDRVFMLDDTATEQAQLEEGNVVQFDKRTKALAETRAKLAAYAALVRY
jgi:hypothetical protein